MFGYLKICFSLFVPRVTRQMYFAEFIRKLIIQVGYCEAGTFAGEVLHSGLK
jgi:hypothetical protein